MLITSIDNERIKKYIKLKEKKYRDQTGEFIVEGSHLVLEAYKKGLIEELILETEEVFPIPVNNIVYIPKELISKISSVETPQMVMALCKKQKEQDDLGKKILLVDDVQDPGNLGTIIRSAVAFNIDTVVLSQNTVDLYNPKTIRSTQGMFFHINILKRDLMEIIPELKKQNIPLYGTLVEHGSDVRTLTKDDKKSFALVVGNEGNGVKREISEICDKNLYIEMTGSVESLNVGVATSILLYELGR
ncbi:MAG: RNA methyltransferase [Bacilli bacterium]|nr:RNA methyltransferase [Bacilli bacterium]